MAEILPPLTRRILTKSSLSLLFLIFPILTFAQNDSKKCFLDWAQSLRKEKALRSKIAVSAPLLDLKLLPKLPFSMEGELNWKFPDTFFLKLNSEVLNYTLLLEESKAYELVEAVKISPRYNFYTKLETSPLSFALESLKRLEKSELEFLIPLEKNFNLECLKNKENERQLLLKAKSPDFRFQEIIVTLIPGQGVPKSIETRNLAGQKEFILFRETLRAPEILEKSFYVPWPENAEISQVN